MIHKATHTGCLGVQRVRPPGPTGSGGLGVQQAKPAGWEGCGFSKPMLFVCVVCVLCGLCVRGLRGLGVSCRGLWEGKERVGKKADVSADVALKSEWVGRVVWVGCR